MDKKFFPKILGGTDDDTFVYAIDVDKHTNNIIFGGQTLSTSIQAQIN
jgi:hypothetical protein